MKTTLLALLTATALWSAPLVALADDPITAEVVAACQTPNRTYIAGQYEHVTMDVNGNLCGSGGIGGGGGVFAPTGQLQYSIVPKAGYASDGVTPITGYAACSIFKPNAGNLYEVGGSVSAGGVYVELFDSATIPADGAQTWKSSGGSLVEVIPLPGAGAWRLDYGIFPAGFLVGITVCVSSTAGLTKTAIASGTNTLVARVE